MGPLRKQDDSPVLGFSYGFGLSGAANPGYQAEPSPPFRYQDDVTAEAVAALQAQAYADAEGEEWELVDGYGSDACVL